MKMRCHRVCMAAAFLFASTNPAAAESISNYLTDGHHLPKLKIETQYSSLVPQRAKNSIVYEFCNFSASDLVFDWVEIYGVTQDHPMEPNECERISFSAPLGVTPGDTTVKYLKAERNAVVHIPIEVKPQGITDIFTELYSRWSQPHKRPKNASADLSKQADEFTVLTRVTNKGSSLEYTVAWKQKISPLAIQYLTEEPAIRE